MDYTMWRRISSTNERWCWRESQLLKVEAIVKPKTICEEEVYRSLNLPL